VDQTFYKQRLPATDKGSLELDLSHVPNGDYSLAVYQIGYKQNDAYTAYVELGAPNQLTREQVRALNAASAGVPISQAKVTVTGGQFSRTVPLRSNDVFLFVLTPMKARRSR
jgi:xylan 1,4-beta-xylosidase